MITKLHPMKMILFECLIVYIRRYVLSLNVIQQSQPSHLFSSQCHQFENEFATYSMVLSYLNLYLVEGISGNPISEFKRYFIIIFYLVLSPFYVSIIRIKRFFVDRCNADNCQHCMECSNKTWGSK